MNTLTFRTKRLLISGSIHKEYLIAGAIILLAAFTVFTHQKSINGGEFLWQALLGIFTGLFVGYMVDTVESWHRTRFLSLVLAPVRVEERLPVVVATVLSDGKSNTSYKPTGPGETIAIGLLYSAYSSLFSTASKVVSGSNISVISSADIDDHDTVIGDRQRIILGGPKHNKLTRGLLANSSIPIHYPKDEQGNYRRCIEFKEGNLHWEWKDGIPNDFGLILKVGRQLHVSGCRTWGVIGAATCLFSEASAILLVEKLRNDGIDPVSDNYFAIIACEVPSVSNEYTIGEVKVDRVGKIVGYR